MSGRSRAAVVLAVLAAVPLWAAASSPSYSLGVTVSPSEVEVGGSITTSVSITVDGLESGTVYATMWTRDPGGRERYYDQSPQWTHADVPVSYRNSWTLRADRPGTWTSCVRLVFDGDAPDGSGYQAITRCASTEVSSGDLGGSGSDSDYGGGGSGASGRTATRLTAAASPNPVEPGEQFTVMGGLFEADQADWWNHPIGGASVRVSFGGRTSAATTSADGGWGVSFTAPSEEGTYTLTVSFSGDSSHSPSLERITVRVRRSPPRRSCSLELRFPARVHVGDTIELTVVLRDSATGQEIRGRPVTLYLDANDVRVESGSTFTVQAVRAGTIDVGARFPGDDLYKEAYAPGGLIEVWTRPEITIVKIGAGG